MTMTLFLTGSCGGEEQAAEWGHAPASFRLLCPPRFSCGFFLRAMERVLSIVAASILGGNESLFHQKHAGVADSDSGPAMG